MSVLWCGGEDIDFPNGVVPVVTTTAGRYRANFARCNLAPPAATNVMKSSIFPGGAVTSAWLSCNLFIVSGAANQRTMFGFGKSGTSSSGIFIGCTSGSVKVNLFKYDGTTLTSLGAEVGASLVTNAGNRIDIQLINYGASATVNVYVAGTLIITFSGDVTVSGVTNVDSVFSTCDGALGTYTFGISEVIVANEDTRSWPGLMTMALTGAGTTTNWTNNTFSNINGTTISDVNPTYTNVNATLQEYNITDLTAGTFNIGAVKIAARATQSASSAVTKVELGYNSGGSVAYGAGATKTLTTGYTTYEQLDLTNPVTGVAFVQADMNALQLDMQALT